MSGEYRYLTATEPVWFDTGLFTGPLYQYTDLTGLSVRVQQPALVGWKPALPK